MNLLDRILLENAFSKTSTLQATPFTFLCKRWQRFTQTKSYKFGPIFKYFKRVCLAFNSKQL